MKAKKTFRFLSILFLFSIFEVAKSSQITCTKNLPRTLYTKNLLCVENQFNKKNLGPSFLPHALTIIILMDISLINKLIIDIIAGNYESAFVTIGILVMPLILISSYIVHHKKLNKLKALDEIVEKLAKNIQKHANENFEKKCLICLSDEEMNLYMNLTCGHFYHKECLSKWLNVSVKNSYESIFKCVVCKKCLIKLELQKNE